MTVQSISAITLAVRDMARSVAFYHRGAGIPILYGGPDAGFTSLSIGDGYLNLILAHDADVRWWGRCILYVDDVDAHHRGMIDAGYTPDGPPADAPWRNATITSPTPTATKSALRVHCPTPPCTDNRAGSPSQLQRVEVQRQAGMREGVFFNLAVAPAGQKAQRRREMIRRPHRRPCVTGIAGKFFRLIQQLRCNAHSASIAVHRQPANFRFVIAAPIYADAANRLPLAFGNPEITVRPLNVAVLNVGQIVGDGAIKKLAKPRPVFLLVQVTLGEILLPVKEQTASSLTVRRLKLSDGNHASCIDQEVDDVAIANRIRLALRAQHTVLATLSH